MATTTISSPRFIAILPMPEELSSKMEASDTNIYTLFFTDLEGGYQLEEPTEYVTFSRNR